MRRSPQEVVNTLAYFLKEGKQGNEFRITELVKKTSMSHITVTYYLDLIEHAQKNIPQIEVVEKPRDSFVRVLSEVDLDLSVEESVLLDLFDRGAFGEISAVSTRQTSKDIISKLVAASMLSVKQKKVYLSADGIIKAAALAGARANRAVSPKESNLIESGEFEIENVKWTLLSQERLETVPISNYMAQESYKKINAVGNA